MVKVKYNAVKNNIAQAWNVRSMNQGKMDMVKQEMAKLNIIILGNSEIKWRGMKAKVLVVQSCPMLWDPVDCSPPGSSVHGIFRQEYTG